MAPTNKKPTTAKGYRVSFNLPAGSNIPLPVPRQSKSAGSTSKSTKKSSTLTRPAGVAKTTAPKAAKSTTTQAGKAAETISPKLVKMALTQLAEAKESVVSKTSASTKKVVKVKKVRTHTRSDLSPSFGNH